jgi:adenine phosphoribosyltransferase
VLAPRIVHADLPPDQPAKRIVHELDGIDRPVEPYRLLLTGSELWGAWVDAHGDIVPDVLVGLGTSSIIPTIAVSIASGLPYQLVWPFGRVPSTHVHDKRVLVVDDQVIHGYTLASFIAALRDEAADVVGALCLIEDTAGTGRLRVESAGVPLCVAKTL